MSEKLSEEMRAAVTAEAKRERRISLQTVLGWAARITALEAEANVLCEHVQCLRAALANIDHEVRTSRSWELVEAVLDVAQQNVIWCDQTIAAAKIGGES